MAFHPASSGAPAAPAVLSRHATRGDAAAEPIRPIAPPSMPLASLLARPRLWFAAAPAPITVADPRATARAQRRLGAFTVSLLLAVVAVARVREAIGGLGRAIDRRFEADEAIDAEDDG